MPAATTANIAGPGIDQVASSTSATIAVSPSASRRMATRCATTAMPSASTPYMPQASGACPANEISTPACTLATTAEIGRTQRHVLTSFLPSRPGSTLANAVRYSPTTSTARVETSPEASRRKPHSSPPTSAAAPSQGRDWRRPVSTSPAVTRPRYNVRTGRFASSPPTSSGAANPPMRPRTALGRPKRKDRPMASAVTSASPPNATDCPTSPYCVPAR